MKLIFISGVYGIDKATLVDLALQHAGRKNDFTVVDFDKIENLAEEIGEIPDIDAIRKVAAKFYDKLQKIMITKLKDQKGNIIVSGYLTFLTRYGYVRAIPDEFFRSFRPDSIVVFEKAGDTPGDDKTNEHQRINRYYASIYSSASGSALKIIKFHEKKMMDSMKELGEMLKQ
ncbi:MAG: AAA family ATPase [Candidatus Aenigmarchaeota archaeon]|nr:AAA family ATPase [Candidatus Aenigmarchaeota archaeon]